MTLAEIRAACVGSFPLSKTRAPIMAGLEHFVSKLKKERVVGDLWVDGSFTTQKIDPEDVDVVLQAPARVREHATQPQIDLIEKIEKHGFKPDHYCHTFIFYKWEQDDPLYWFGEWTRAYWIRQFGFSRGSDFKGLAVVEVR